MACVRLRSLFFALALGLAACADPNPPGNTPDAGDIDSGDVGDIGADACVANCEGKQGGESDGCGGECPCVPENDFEFCERLGATCGTLKAPDTCEEEREVSCGECDARQRCDEAHRCVCAPYTDDQLCAAALKECGALGEVDDGCGNAVEVLSCGTCPKHTFCGPDGACEPCVPENDLEFCVRHGVECGSLETLDNCEYARKVAECGTETGCGAMMLCTPHGKCLGAHRPKNDACGDPDDENIEPEELLFDETTGYAYAYGAMDKANAYKKPTAPGEKEAESLGTVISCIEGTRNKSRDVVYTFSLAEPTTISVSLATAWEAAALELRSACGVVADSTISCKVDLSKGSIALPPQNLGAGQYWLWVASPGRHHTDPNPAPGLFALTVLAVPIAEVAENDKCDSLEPLLLVSGVIRVSADLRKATGQLAGGCGSAQILHPEVVYLLDLPLAGSLKATARPNATDGNGVEPYLYLRRACEKLSSEVLCTPYADGRAELHAPRLAAGAWYLVVDATTDAMGLVDLEVELADPLPRPEGDICSDELVPLTFQRGDRITVKGDLFAAGDDSDTPCPGTGASPEFVHVFELTEPAYVGIVLQGDETTKGYLPALHTRPSCAAIHGTHCGDSEAYARRAVLNAGLLEAPFSEGRHYIFVEGLNQNVGKYEMVITKYPVERNDTCETAVPLSNFDEEDKLVAYGSLRESFARQMLSCAPVDMLPGLAAVYEIAPPRDATLRGKITSSPGQTLALIAEVRRDCDDVTTAIRGTCTPPVDLISPAEFVVRHVSSSSKYYLWIRSRALYSDVFSEVVVPGDFTIELQLFDPVTPSNDLCEGASELIFDNDVARVTKTEDGEPLDTRFASDDYAGSCGTPTLIQNGPDLVWYFDVTAPIAIQVKVSKTGAKAAGPLAFSLRRSCAASTPTDEVLCAYSTGGDFVSTTHSILDDPGRYFLVVDELGTEDAPALGGQFELEVTRRQTLQGDSCAIAADLGDVTGLEKQLSGDTRLAYRDMQNDSSCRNSEAAKDLVYAFTLTEVQTVELTVTPTTPSYNPVVSIRSSCGAAETLVPGACARNETIPGVRRFLFGRMEAGTYYIWISGYSLGGGVLADGAFALELKASSPPSVPLNSGCGQPQLLALSHVTDGIGKYATVSADTTYSRNLDEGGGPCPGASGPDLTFKFTIDSFPEGEKGLVLATVIPADGSSLIPAVSIRRLSDCDSALAQEACGFAKLVNPVAASAKVGNGEYVVVVDGVQGSAGAFTLDILARPPLWGDTCDQAETLEFGAPIDGVATATMLIEDLAQAGDDAQTLFPATICSMAGRDVVYVLDLRAGGRKVEITVKGAAGNSVYRPAFSVRQVCGDIFSEIGCKGLGGTTESATFNWLSPGLYYIWVDAYTASSARGRVEVTVKTTDVANAPTNYSCETALDISQEARTHTPIEGTTEASTNNIRGTCENSALTQNLSELVYKYTAESTTGLEMLLSSENTYSHVLVVRSVCESGAAAHELACMKTAAASFLMTTWSANAYVPRIDAGQTIYIIIDTTMSLGQARPGPFRLEVHERPAAENDTCEAAEELMFEEDIATAQGDTRYASNTTHAYANNTMSGPMTSAGLYGSTNSGFYCPELFYKFSIEAGKAYSVKATVVPADPVDGLKTVLYVRPSCAPDFVSVSPYVVLPPVGYGLAQVAHTSDTSAAFSLLMPRLDAGTYYVVVDSYGSDVDCRSGAFELSVERTEILPEDVPPNALCGEATATLLDFADATVDGTARTKEWPLADTRRAGDSMQGSCGILHGGDLFYKLSLASERRVTATVTRSPNTAEQGGYTPALYLRKNCAQGFENEVACSVASEGVGGKSGIAMLVQPVLGPGTWYLVVDGNQYSGGTFVLSVALDTPAPVAPTNDSCFSPMPILVDVESEVITATTGVAGGAALANNDAVASCVDQAVSSAPGYSAQDLVYSIAIDRPRRLTAQILESNGIRPALFLRKECGLGGFSNEVFCSRADAPGGVVAPISAVLPEGLWYLWVDGYAATAGTFTLGVELTEIAAQLPPANDNCQGEVPPLSANVPVTGDTTFAEADYGWRKAMPCGFGGGVVLRVPRGKDVVYSYTPTKDGLFLLHLTPHGSTPNDRPEVWVTKTLCGEESACVAMARTSPGGGKLSQLPVWGEAGVTYYLIVGSATGATPQWSGKFTLEVRVTEP